MLLQSVRDLKIELARDVFAKLREDILERALKPKLGTFLRPSPMKRLALGIGRGRAPGEFWLAVRLQKNPLEASPQIVKNMVQKLTERAENEIDIRFIGRPRAQDDAAPASTELKKKARPLIIGCSVGHVAMTAGTLGLLARHRKTGHPVMLSNSHVLALGGKAKSGEPITQPGRRDGGGPNTLVGALLDSTPLKTDSHNQVDAAIAMIDDTIEFKANDVPGLGAFTIGAEDAIQPGVKVVKLGRTTGLRHGEIQAIELDDVGVDYDIGTLYFDNQIEIQGEPGLPFSADGDSGSLVLDEQMRAIAIVFAGEPRMNGGRGVSFANRLPTVMTMLDIIPL